MNALAASSPTYMTYLGRLDQNLSIGPSRESDTRQDGTCEVTLINETIRGLSAKPLSVEANFMSNVPIEYEYNIETASIDLTRLSGIDRHMWHYARVDVSVEARSVDDLAPMLKSVTYGIYVMDAGMHPTSKFQYRRVCKDLSIKPNL